MENKRLECRVYDNDVILDRPPGGATILWVERRGMWSSTWAPEKASSFEWVISFLLLFPVALRHISQSAAISTVISERTSDSTCQGESGLVEIPSATQDFRTGWPPCHWSRWDRFRHANDIMDWIVIVSPWDAAGVSHLREINKQLVSTLNSLCVN